MITLCVNELNNERAVRSSLAVVDRQVVVGKTNMMRSTCKVVINEATKGINMVAIAMDRWRVEMLLEHNGFALRRYISLDVDGMNGSPRSGP